MVRARRLRRRPDRRPDPRERVADVGTVINLELARRRRRGIPVAVGVTAVVTGTAVAAIWNRSPQEATRVTCWSEAVVPPAERVEASWDGVTDPATLCAIEWSVGRFTEPAPPAELRVCVTDDGATAVIPGAPEVCITVGFAAFSPLDDGSPLAVNRATAELDRTFNTQTCRPLAGAEEEIKRVLEQFGLSGWTVTITGTSGADNTCATVFLAPDRATAIVVPVPRQR